MIFGSGKFGTPWLRMHRASLSPRWRCCAACAGLASVRGMLCWHFCRAAANAEALTETPLTEMFRPLASIRIPLSLKSGKFGAPLARMHLENTRAPGASALGPVEPELAALREPPPHPANRTPPTTAATAS